MKVSVGVVLVMSLMMSGEPECKEKNVTKYKTAWVLNKYKSVNDHQIEHDTQNLLQRIREFDIKCIKKLTIDNLKEAITEYDKICAAMSEMYSYFGLSFKLNTKDNNLSNACQKMTEIYSKCNETLCKFEIAMQKLEHRAKHDENRNGLPWLLYLAQEIIAKDITRNKSQ